MSLKEMVKKERVKIFWDQLLRFVKKEIITQLPLNFTLFFELYLGKFNNIISIINKYGLLIFSKPS